MTVAQITGWFQRNAKGVMITAVTGGVIAAIILTLYHFFGKNKSGSTGTNDVDTTDVSQATIDRMTAIFAQYKPLLTKDELYYKGLADSLATDMKSNGTLFWSNYFDPYFSDLDTPGFVAMWYYWGAKREFTGAWYSTMLPGDKYGDMITALKTRASTKDYNKIQEKFSNTGLI